MGDITDWMFESGMLDHPDPFDHDEYGGAQPSMAYCRRCGQRIEFVHSGVRWRLYEPGAVKLHACNPPVDSSEFKPIKD